MKGARVLGEEAGENQMKKVVLVADDAEAGHGTTRATRVIVLWCQRELRTIYDPAHYYPHSKHRPTWPQARGRLVGPVFDVEEQYCPPAVW